jgi:hypothetical protein
VNYERQKTGTFKSDISKRKDMAYDALRDEYTCANNDDTLWLCREVRHSIENSPTMLAQFALS